MIGYVPQKVQLDPDIPVRARDLVALGLDGHRYGLPRTSRVQRARVQRALAAVDAEHLADARVGLLSGGEQQRILIAHALIGRPSVLLLDEPLTNLDPASAYHVVKLLAAIAADHQIAVVVSAHEMNTLLPVLDQVIYLANGRAAHGPTERVIRADVLTRLYGQPVEVLRVGNRVLVITGEHIDGADATTGPTPTCQA